VWQGRVARWARRPLGPVWQVGLMTTLFVVVAWLVGRIGP